MDIAISLQNIQAIGSFLLFGATGLLVLTNRKLVIANQDLVNEVRKDREERIKPYITMSLFKVVRAYVLRFANVGGSPAYGIEISCRTDTDRKIPIINRLYQNNGFSLSVGNEEFFGIKGVDSIKVNIKYKDRSGNPYNDEATFKLGFAEEGIEAKIFGVLDRMEVNLGFIKNKLPEKPLGR